MDWYLRLLFREFGSFIFNFESTLMDLVFLAIIFVTAFTVSALLTPWIGKLARKFDVITYPPKEVLSKISATSHVNKPVNTATLEAKIIAARRRSDKPPMPKWGGIAYILPFLVISIGVLLLSKTINIPSSELQSYVFWFIAIIILFVMGIVDDKYELTGRVQIIFHILAALIFVISPLDLRILTNPLGGAAFGVGIADLSTTILGINFSVSLPGDIFLFFWILIFINAIKWQGGTDALMEGNVFISSLLIFIVSFIFLQPASALFSIVLAGCMLGFLIYNFFPAKIWSGSAGKSVIGFIVATLAIVSNAKFAISLIIFAIPLIDMVIVLVKRIIDHKPKSIFQLLLISDRTHFHHKLLKLGLTEPQIVILECTVTLILGMAAIFLQSTQKFVFIGIAWVLVLVMILYVTIRTNEKRN